MTRHTSGEWRAASGYSSGAIDICCDNEVVARVLNTGNADETAANAALLAGAAAVLEAAEVVAEYLRDSDAGVTAWGQKLAAQRRLEAAIAKAQP